jgi:hypothetical protein
MSKSGFVVTAMTVPAGAAAFNWMIALKVPLALPGQTDA